MNTSQNNQMSKDQLRNVIYDAELISYVDLNRLASNREKRNI